MTYNVATFCSTSYADACMTLKIDARWNEHCKQYYLFTQFTYTLVPENVEIAVGIFILSHLGAKITELPVWWPLSWISNVWGSSDSILSGFTEKLIPENSEIAVGIFILSHLGPRYKYVQFSSRYLGFQVSEHIKQHLKQLPWKANAKNYGMNRCILILLAVQGKIQRLLCNSCENDCVTGFEGRHIGFLDSAKRHCIIYSLILPGNFPKTLFLSPDGFEMAVKRTART
jgi:hypothetical protein